jgi:lysophospholipase L1-like esterase
MPVGDSITDGQGSANGHGYRDDLYALLVAEGWDFAFVGDSGESPYQGHFGGGGRIADFYPAGFGNGWGTGIQDIAGAMSTYAPNVLLIHLGTNDLTCDQPPYGPYSTDGGQSFLPNASGRLAELLTYVLRWSNGQAGLELETVVLCQIIPIQDRDPDVCSFNSHIAHMLEEFNTGSVTGTPEHVLRCDQYFAFASNPLLFSGEPGDYMDDALHPNDLGYAVMAESFLATLLDNTPPAAVQDLSATPTGCYDAVLSWTAVGDDALWGTATSYEAFLAPFPVTPLTVARAFPLPGLPQPAPPGSHQAHTACGLPDGVESWFALRTVDAAGNVSALSNTPSASTPQALSRPATFGSHWESQWLADSSYEVSGELLTVAPGEASWAPVAVFRGARAVDQVGATWCGGGSLCALAFLDTVSAAAHGWAVVWTTDSVRLAPVSAGVVGSAVASRPLVAFTLSSGDSLEAVMVGGREERSCWCYHNNLCRGLFEIPDTSSPSFGGVALSPSDPVLLGSFWVKGRELDAAPADFSLLTPQDGDTVFSLAPQLSWEQALDPAQPVTYVAEIDTSPSFDSPVHEAWTGLADTTFTPPEPLLPLPHFWWRVKAVDASGMETSCLQSFSFWVEPSLEAAEPWTPPQPTVTVLGNPSPAGVHLLLQGFTGHARVELYSAVGRLAHRQTVALAKSRYTVALVPRVTPGAYLVRVSDGRATVCTRAALFR